MHYCMISLTFFNFKMAAWLAIIDGFYYQKVAFVNGKVRLLAGC